MTGFSPRNLKYMRKFAESWPDPSIVQEVLAQITWYHNPALLVRDKNRTVVEYALAGFTKPIGVAQWERQITQSLPDELKSSLPTVEEIEAELKGELG
jgi:hypothetical protein